MLCGDPRWINISGTEQVNVARGNSVGKTGKGKRMSHGKRTHSRISAQGKWCSATAGEGGAIVLRNVTMNDILYERENQFSVRKEKEKEIEGKQT